MSIIEKAAQRLEQLRQAGVETPHTVPDPGAEKVPGTPAQERGGAQERHAELLQTVHLADAGENGDGSAAGEEEGAPHE